MPNVDSEPLSHRSFLDDGLILRELRPLRLNEDELKNLDLSLLQNSLVYIVEKAKLEDPFNQELVEQKAYAMFGPLIHPDYRQRINNKDKAVISAQAQQQIIHDLLFASLNIASPKYIEAAYQMAKACETICAFNKTSTPEFRGMWNGIKVQVSLMKALMAAGYKVRLPSYSTFSKETLEWDVIDHVDFVATPPISAVESRFLCLDAKSDLSLTDFGGFRIAKPLEDISPDTPAFKYLTQSLQQTVRRSQKEAVRAAIYVSPHPMHIDRFDLNERNHRSALRHFARLQTDIGRSIIYELQSAMAD